MNFFAWQVLIRQGYNNPNRMQG